MAERMTGRIKWFSGSKGFGYITPDDPERIPNLEPGDQGVYVHITGVSSERPLHRNQQVAFELGATKKGKPKALNVQLEDAAAEEPEPLEKWLRILLPGYAPIAEIAAFLRDLEKADEADEEIWVPESIWDSEWGQENCIEEDPWSLRHQVVHEAISKWLAGGEYMEGNLAWNLYETGGEEAVFSRGSHADLFQVNRGGKWLAVALIGDEGYAYYRELPGNEPLPPELHD